MSMSAAELILSGDELDLPPTLDSVDDDASPLHAALKNLYQADSTNKPAGKLVAKSLKFSFDESGDLKRVLALMKAVEAAAAAVAVSTSSKDAKPVCNGPKDHATCALWPAKAFVGLGHELVLIMLMRSKSDDLILWTLRLAARLDLAKASFPKCCEADSAEAKEDKFEESKSSEEECEFTLLMQCATELHAARPIVSAEVIALLFEIMGGRTSSAASFKGSETAGAKTGDAEALALLQSRPFTKIQRPVLLRIITHFLCGKATAETYLASIEHLNFLLYQHEENCDIVLRNLSDWYIWLVPFLNAGYQRSVIVWQNPDDSSDLLKISEGKVAEDSKEAERKSKLLDPEFAERAKKSFGLEVNVLIILLFHTLKTTKKSKMEGVTKTLVELIKRLEKENVESCGDITRVLLHGLLKKLTFRFDDLTAKSTVATFLKNFQDFLYVVVDFIFLAETIVGSPLAASLHVNVPDAILTQESLVVLTKILGHPEVKELGSKLETEKLVQRITNSLALFKELHEFLIAMQDSDKAGTDPAILDETCTKLTANIHKWKKEAIKGTERRSIFEKPRKSSMFRVAAPTIPTGPGEAKTNRKRFSSLLAKTPFELDNDRILESVKKYSSRVYRERHDSVKGSIPPTSDLSVIAATAKAILKDKIEAK